MVLTFDSRLTQHEDFRRDVAAYFRNRSCLVHERGVEQMDKDFHRALVRCGDNLTAQFLRFEPDQALVVVSQGAAHLCEIKSSAGNHASGQITYELASLETAITLQQFGISVFVVFGNWTATWAQDIALQRRYDDPAFLSRVRGSGTPFGTFPRDARFLRPLDQFATEELGCPLPF